VRQFPRRPLVERLLTRLNVVPVISLICLALPQSPSSAQVVDSHVPDGPTRSRPATPLANSVSEAETVLPPQTPDYLEAVYPHLLKAPLPAKI
jgi:hypothetical protein